MISTYRFELDNPELDLYKNCETENWGFTIEAIMTDADDELEINKIIRQAEKDWSPDVGIIDSTPKNPYSGIIFKSAGNIELKEEREIIIDKIVRRRQLLNVVSASKGGKSFFTQQVAVCVASGTPFLGFVTRPGRSKVLLIDYENDEINLENRIFLMSQEMGIPMEELKTLEYVALDGQRLDVFAVEKMLTDIEFELVVIDCLYWAKPAELEENSNDHMSLVYNQFMKIAKKCNTAVLIVHHTAKGGGKGSAIVDMGRGASAIGGATGSQLIIRPDGDYDDDTPEEDIVYKLELKCRSFKSPPPTRIQFKYPVWKLASKITEDSNDLNPKDKEVLKWWKEILPVGHENKLSKSEIEIKSSRRGMGEARYVEAKIKYASSERWINYIMGGPRKNAKEYYWTPEGEEALARLEEATGEAKAMARKTEDSSVGKRSLTPDGLAEAIEATRRLELGQN